jgi:hypothetical protein
MANDLETMRQRLRDALYDVDDVTWNAGEKDDILQMAVRRISQRLPRPLDPTAAAYKITLVTGTYYYAVPADVITVERLFYIDGGDNPIGYMQAGFEVVGDITTGNAKLHIAPVNVERGGTMQIGGTGRYTLVTQASAQTSAIPDDYIPLIIAWSVAYSLRRLLVDRARFRQWQNTNQTQNVSINELSQMVSDADRQADQEWVGLKRWGKPVIGRI